MAMVASQGASLQSAAAAMPSTTKPMWFTEEYATKALEIVLAIGRQGPEDDRHDRQESQRPAQNV